MDEERILKLVQAAVELDELEATVLDGTRPPTRGSSFRRRVRRGWLAVPLAVAATVAFVALRTPPLAITGLEIQQAVTRGENEGLTLRFHLNRSAHIGIIAIDERNERWLIPFGGEATAPFRRLSGSQSIQIPPHPGPEDARGPARATALLVIASEDGFDAPDLLLEAVPDPVAPPGTSLAALEARLRTIVDELSVRYDWIGAFVYVKP
jgi:hypothetical protein